MSKTTFGILAIVLSCSAVCMAQDVIYDINKDVHNASGAAAHGFKMVLLGEPKILDHFDGFSNAYRFESSAFEQRKVNGTTVLLWRRPLNPGGQAEPIPYCTWVHVGYKLDRQADILEACWTDANGDCLPDGVIRQATQVVDQDDGTFRLTIRNALRDGLPLSISVVGYAQLDERMPLSDLNRLNIDEGALTPFPGAEGEIQLAHDQSVTFTAPMTPPPPGKKTIFIYVKKNKDYVDYGQSCLGPGCKVPTLSQWGLIAMVLALLTTGTLVMVRRKRLAAA